MNSKSRPCEGGNIPGDTAAIKFREIRAIRGKQDWQCLTTQVASTASPNYALWLFYERDAEGVVDGSIRERPHGVHHALVGAEQPDEHQGRRQADQGKYEERVVAQGVHGLLRNKNQRGREKDEQEASGEE